VSFFVTDAVEAGEKNGTRPQLHGGAVVRFCTRRWRTADPVLQSPVEGR